MVRRRTIEEPPSRLAIWARRVALFSLAATLIAVIVVRSGALEIVPALSTLAGALVLAVVAILMAIGAAIVIWFEVVGGAKEAATALCIGFALIAYPLYLGIKGYQLPAIYDVTTDPIDPPRFEVNARPPQGSALRPLDTRAPPGPAPRDGFIEAIARTPILGFRDDVVVRVRSTSDGTRIDVRSASRYGRHDLGTNAARVRNLISDIDDVLAAPRKPSPAPAPTTKPQAPGKPTARR